MLQSLPRQDISCSSARETKEEPLRVSFSGGTKYLNLGFLVFITEDEHQEHAPVELAEINT